MRKLIYVFLNLPVGGKPYIDTIYKSNAYLDSIYERVKGEYIKKRDLERLGIIFPAGPRYIMLPYEINESFFTQHIEPCGPDIFDIRTAQFIEETAQFIEEVKNSNQPKYN